MKEVRSRFVHGPDRPAGPEGVFRKVFGPEEAQPFEGPVRDIRPRSCPLRVGYAREETASAPIILEEPAGGWIRMPVRAPVTDPELCASVQKYGETSDAKFISSELTTHR